MDNPANNYSQEPSPQKKKLFGRGIYGSKDVPIRLLDGLIAVLIGVAILLTIIFTVTGGFRVTFDTHGGSEVTAQKLRHGKLIEEPEIPTKAGYVFNGWKYSEEEENAYWDFSSDEVQGDLVLYADWAPAQIQVKFELDGGTYNGASIIDPGTVTYGEGYGELPQPEKEGYTFGGWMYSGSIIEPDTVVTMTGEHVLSAIWK